MLDINVDTVRLDFFSDASAAKTLGFRAIYEKHWLHTRWETNYIHEHKPSIEYLELYTVTAALLSWGHLIQNKRILIHCDNQAVMEMLNKSTSSCGNCMYLLRLIIMDNLIYIRRVFAEYVRSADNDFADALSRLQLTHFWKLVSKNRKIMNQQPTPISDLVWPASLIWKK